MNLGVLYLKYIFCFCLCSFTHFDMDFSVLQSILPKLDWVIEEFELNNRFVSQPSPFDLTIAVVITKLIRIGWRLVGEIARC